MGQTVIDRQRPYAELKGLASHASSSRGKKADWKSYATSPGREADVSALATAQGEVCVYCEMPIDGSTASSGRESGKRPHMEHIVPRSKQTSLVFDPANVVLSCSRKESCGHAKKDRELPVVPGPGCNDGWILLNDGTLHAPDSPDHATTADILGLNAVGHRSHRERLVEAAKWLLECDIPTEEIAESLAVDGAANYLRSYLRDV